MATIARIGTCFGIDRSAISLLLSALGLCVASLANAQAGADTLNLWWTAPGDDGTSGIASLYDLRYSTTPISPLNFGAATAVPSLLPPSAAGSTEHVVVRGLTRGTDYWFAIRTRDDAGKWSPLSNVLFWQWSLDRSPPATPQSVSATITPDGKQVRLQWRAGSEPDLAGYFVYRAGAQDGPWTRLTPTVLTIPVYVDESLPLGDIDVWYSIASVDVAGNQSSRTPPLRMIRNSAAASIKAWKLKAAYPNPARVGEIQHLPIELPRGAGIAQIEILDSAGQRVRRLAVPLAGPGFGEITWDGRNDVGALVAPGLYRAWLAADGERQFAKLVRVP